MYSQNSFSSTLFVIFFKNSFKSFAKVTLVFANDLPGIAKTYGWRFSLSEKGEKSVILLNIKQQINQVIILCGEKVLSSKFFSDE